MQENSAQIGPTHEAQAVSTALDDAITFRAIYHPFGRIYPIGRGEDRKAPVQGFSPKRYAASKANIETLTPWLDAPDRSGWAMHIESTVLAIIDCEHPDKKESPGPDGITNFKNYCQSLGIELPEHPTVRSGSGGIHDLFLIPAGLIPAGQYVCPGYFLPGVELLTFGRNVIMPGSIIETWRGPGVYEALSGFEAGIPEMPRPLAIAIIEKLGLREITVTGKQKKSKTKNEAARPRVGPAGVQFANNSNGPINDAVEAAVNTMLRFNAYFPRLWANEASDSYARNKTYDDTPSAMLFNIAGVAIKFGYDEGMVTAIAQYWCTIHSRPFGTGQWRAIYAKALIKKGRGKEVVTKVQNPPPTQKNSTACQELPTPTRPSEEKLTEFEGIKKAALSLSGNRPDFNSRHHDKPDENDWRWTKSYLISIFYYALCVNCNEEEVLWHCQEFIRNHSPSFELTAERFAALGKLAERRREQVCHRKNIRQGGQQQRPNKKRKLRSDRGSGKKLKQVARLMDRGFGYRRIAAKLGIDPSTARYHLRTVVEYGGTDCILRAKAKAKKAPELLQSPLAESLFQICKERRHAIRTSTANSVIEEVMDYASKVDMAPAVTNDLLLRAVVDAKDLTKKSLVKFLTIEIANSVSGRDASITFIARMFRFFGWPGSTHVGKYSTTEPNRFGSPKAVLLAFQVVQMLRTWIAQTCIVTEQYKEDAVGIWRSLKKHKTVRFAV